MKFKELKTGTIFVFDDKPTTLCLLSYNRATKKNDVVFLSGNFFNVGQIYEKWGDKGVRVLPHVKTVLQNIAAGQPSFSFVRKSVDSKAVAD